MPTSIADEFREQLLSAGILTPQQVEDLQTEADGEDVDLETVIRKRRLLSSTQLGALRGMRLGVPYCSVSDFIPQLQNAELLTEDLARGHMMFPLFCIDEVITLVMEDPNDLAGIDQVRRLTKREVDACLSSREEVLGLIERAYGARSFMQQSVSVLEAADADALGGSEEGDRPVIRLVDELINQASREGASDIHIEAGERELRIRIRVDGVLRDVAAPPLGLHRAIVSRIKVLARLDISKSRAPQDGAFHYRGEGVEVVIRVSVLPSVFGEAVVLRLLRNESESITLPDLGMSAAMLERFRAIIGNAYGMILVSGPTGSGKSTTLYAAMRTIASPQKNIIAIEDPVEYRTSLIRQVQVNPEAKLTFAGGLRSILRQDPDVIMVGEIRDGETAQISVQAALTGHLVLSTVHTNDAIGAIARLRDLGVAEYLISASLLAVVAQRLCRRICPDCSEPDHAPAYLLRALGLDPDNLGFQPVRGKGCRRCSGTGYLGRTGLFELFQLDETCGEMIVRCEPLEAIRAKVRAAGTKFLIDDGVDKIRRGLTTVEEVGRVAGRR